MSTQLKASLQLTLEDKLTAGLGKLEKQLQQLRDIAKTLGLPQLEDALDQLPGGTDQVDALARGLRGVETQADRTARAIRSMAQSANDNVIRVNSGGVATLNRSLGALTIIAGGGAGGSAGGGGGTSASLAGAPLLLEGPAGATGIPINLGRSHAYNLAMAGSGVLGASRRFGIAASEGINGLFGAAAEAFAVAEPIKAYADYENTLRHIAITERKSGAAVDAEIKRLTAMFAKDALETGQSSKTLADAYTELVQMGIPSSIIDKALHAHSQAATAYNISALDLGPAVGALLQNFKIPETELGPALAAMAQAAKEGRFKIEDFSRQLPGISGQMALLGMTGRKSADTAFAALETVMKNSSEPNQAAADLFDALHYIVSPVAGRSFAKVGIDLPGMLKNAEKQGVNPLDAVLGKLGSRVQGMSPVTAAEYLGGVLHNQQAGTAILSLIQHRKEFVDLRKLLDGVNSASLNTDFITAFAAPAVQLRIFNEQLQQLNRILGEGFYPVVMVVNLGLHALLVGLTWMNTHMPVTLHVALGLVAGLLALGAALAVLGFVGPAVVAGFGVVVAVFTGLGAVLAALFSPIGLLVATLSAAAYGIYADWANIEPFFETMWTGVKTVFTAFADFVRSVFQGDLHNALMSLANVGDGLGQIFSGMWDVVKQVFDDFLKWIDSWTGGLGKHIRDGITNSLHSSFADNFMRALSPDGVISGFSLDGLPQLKPPGASSGAPGAAGAPPVQQVGGTITVQAAPGTAITQVDSLNPRVPILTVPAANRGRVLNRP